MGRRRVGLGARSPAFKRLLLLRGGGAAALLYENDSPSAITPTLGAEKHTEANAASDPNGEADATTGWFSSNCTVVSQSADANVGTYALLATSNNAPVVGKITNYMSAAVGDFVRLQADAKAGAGSGQEVGTFYGAVSAVRINLTSVWTSYDWVIRTTVTNPTIEAHSGGVNGNEVYVDNVSVKKLSNLTAKEADITPRGMSHVHWHIQPYKQAGLEIVHASSGDKIQVYADRAAGKIYARKYVASTWADIANANFTYDATKTVWAAHYEDDRWLFGYEVPATVEGWTPAQAATNALIDNNTLTDTNLNSVDELHKFSTDSNNAPQRVYFKQA